MPATHHVVFSSSYAAPSAERAMVLRTQGISADTLVAEGGHVVVVAAADALRAQAELADYERELNEREPPAAPFRHEQHSSWPGVAVYFAIVIFLALTAVSQPGGEWFAAGKVDAGLVRDGQWWRTLTALTLHVDLPHLAGNLVFGGVFGYLAGQLFGSGLAWAVIVLAGASGNVLNSVLMSPSHTSVGASTSIFAALGLLAAYAWKRKYYPQDRWAYRLGPIIAGIALLAYLGTGGERTDVSAHITGYFCGALAGVALALTFDRLPRGVRAQWVYGLLTLAVLGFAWLRALN